MSHTIWYYYPCAIAIITFTLFIKWQRKKRSRLPYPPGPKGLPLIGNVRDIPNSQAWLTYAQWTREYDSDIIYLNLLGTHLVVLNSAEAAFELLDKRSEIYSDRPRLPMLTELMGLNMFSLYRYGNKWRTARRIFHQYFNLQAAEGFQPQQIKATHELLYRLARMPEDFRDHVRLMAGSLILGITYGFDVRSIDDPYIVMAEESMKVASNAANPGAFLVDTIPLLKHVPEWVPGAGFKRKAREWRRVINAAAELPYRDVKDAMEKGMHNQSVTSQALEQFENNKEMGDNICAVSASAFAGGSDTTVSALHTFFFAMVLYPDVVRKAQEELDTVVGQDRLPEFSDKPYLPYVCAILREVLRWYPVTPLGLVHRLMEDDVYEGKYLPSGSLVLGNIWAILHDESVYKDPETFNPERFLKDGQLDPDVRSSEFVAFGFGRRICPGRHLLLSSLFMNIACILATFDIGKALDENGKPIIPSREFTSGLFCRPLPFKCSLKPRSPQVSRLIAEAYAGHN